MRLRLVGTHYESSDRLIYRVHFHPYVTHLGLYISDYLAPQCKEGIKRYYLVLFEYDFETCQFQEFERIEILERILDANFVILSKYNFDSTTLSEFFVVTTTSSGQVYFVEFTRREASISLILNRSNCSVVLPNCPFDEVLQDYPTLGPVVIRCLDGCILIKILYEERVVLGVWQRSFNIESIYFGERVLVSSARDGMLVAALRNRVVLFSLREGKTPTAVADIRTGIEAVSVVSELFRPIVHIIAPNGSIVTVKVDKKKLSVVNRSKIEINMLERYEQVEISEYGDKIVLSSKNEIFVVNMSGGELGRLDLSGIEMAAALSEGMLFCTTNNILLAYQIDE